MYTLFISDLHLDHSRPALTEIFLKFLQTQAKQADALYILGDFFEVWLGDAVQTPFTQKIIQALTTLAASGIPIYYMHGNRDFLIGQQFLQQSGCQLLSDPTVIQLYGKAVLLMHGDTLCTQDKAYLRFRQLARNPLYQRLFLRLPLAIRRKIAGYLRKQSRQNSRRTDYLKLSDATEEAIKQVIQEHHVELLIHGHTHRPCLEFNYQIPFQRIVLSDWEKCGNTLIYSSDHTYRLVDLT